MQINDTFVTVTGETRRHDTMGGGRVAIDKNTLAAQVDALRAYRQAQLKTYYDDEQDVQMVDECVSMDRLTKISEATGVKYGAGLRDSDGMAVTQELTWSGCRFWAPIGM